MKTLLMVATLMVAVAAGLGPLLARAPATPLHDELRWTESRTTLPARG